MADQNAVKFLEDIYDRVDRQVRDIVAPIVPLGTAEVDSIDILVGDGATVLATGLSAALRVDFQAEITGSFLQEIDGTTGSVTISIDKAPGGPSPAWTSIVGSTPPGFTSGRYAADELLTGWTTMINRGDVLRFSVASVSLIKRLLITLRIRRLEP